MARSCSGWSTSNHFSRSDTGITNEPFTIACWFKTANVAVAARALMTLSDNVGTGYYMLQLNTLGEPQAAKQNPSASTGSSSSGVALTANKWTFAAALYASNTSRFAYSEGTLGTENTTSLTDPTVRRQLVGIRERNTGFDLAFDGSIALPTIWDVVLAEPELDAMNAGMHPARIRPKNIVRAWWNPTSGSRLVDFSGGQKTLSLTGTVTNDAFGPPVEPYIYGMGWPSNAPLIEAAAAGGQPYRKRLGGVPFAAHQRGVW